MSKILKLNPYYSEKIWGYENWSLSTHKNGHCTIENSEETLLERVESELPILIKVIKANDTLSVQVHPDDEFSQKHENDNGKTECWYVLEAKEDASLICGIKEGHNKESFYKVIEDGNIEDNLERISVKVGDMIYIPVGTVHAIEGGFKLVEVQQSSDVTYRMYDWGRGRELHIEKSLEVIDYEGKNKGGKIENFSKLETPYFTVEKICVDKNYKDSVNHDFHSYTVIGGNGSIVSDDQVIELVKEDTVYIPKGVDYTINGDIELLKSYV
ncbi:type I phosphomannose isomerase catalytic subunit [Romboutsia sp. Marseille-P6047]|uniref:type I phosphomannose isomerase catalytic subunit n=1 Tax=Romboutsia sp. Marseille-P6047 TaxID=2161817 RepID=UPI000F06CFAC|nr:type I phosphomannose isomerase catalytic subunit [Romboutsia sp. Marseille-P6047]